MFERLREILRDLFHTLTISSKQLASNVTGSVALPTKTVDGYNRGKHFRLLVAQVSPGKWLQVNAAVQYLAMDAAAKTEGIKGGIPLNSAFRENTKQSRLYKKYLESKRRGLKRGDPRYQPLTARPGYSNHQRGLSVDITRLKTSVPPEGARVKWLRKNAKRFGFVNDVKSEPWHWTFKK